MKPAQKVFIIFFFILSALLLHVLFSPPAFAQQRNPTKIQKSPAPSGNNTQNNQVLASPSASPATAPNNPAPTQDRILVASPSASPSNTQNNQVFAPEKIQDIQVTAQIEFKNPLSLDQFLALQKRLGLNKAILESDFIYKGEKIHDFYPVNDPNVNILENYKKSRAGFLKMLDESKQASSQKLSIESQNSAGFNLKLTKIDSNTNNVSGNSTDSIFQISRITLFDKKSKIESLKTDLPDAQIKILDMGQQVLPSLSKVSAVPSPAPSTYVSKVPVSGSSVFGSGENGGRAFLQYMTWDTINFAGNETYEHDVFLDNNDSKTFLDPSDNGFSGDCLPQYIYIGLTWPQQEVNAYLDTRFSKALNGCEKKDLSYTLGAAKADKFKAKTNYAIYFETAPGNTLEDKYTVELQVGYMLPNPCPFNLSPTWCSEGYDYGHIIVIPEQPGNGVMRDPSGKDHIWTNLVGGVQPWKYTGVAPVAPSNVSVENISSDTQKLSFTDNSTNEENWVVEIKINSGNWINLASVGELQGYGTYSVSVSPLSPNTQYCYRFKTVNKAGSSAWSNEACSKASKAEVIVDERSNDFSKGGPFWDADLAYNGHIFWTYVNGNKVNSWGEWKAELTNGNYEVFAYIPKNYATTTNAKYEISYNGGTAIKSVNQKNFYNEWVSLGTYSFAAGRTKRVRLTDATGESNYKLQIGFDAIKFVPK